MRQLKNANKFIKEAARRIGEKFHPQKVILFGSYASGNPNRESDIDLLIIFRDKKKLPQRYSDISRTLEPRPFPVDLLVRSTKEIQDRLKLGDSFIKEVVQNGKVLYES